MNKHPYGDDLRKLNAHLSMLQVSAQDIANMTVKISRGSYWTNGTYFYDYAGGNSQIIAAPTICAYWVAVTLKRNNVVLIYGAHSATDQVFPNIPKDQISLAAIFIKNGATAITNDMIFDLRHIFSAGGYQEAHNDLSARDAADCHPMSAITGLADKFAKKTSFEDVDLKVANKADVDGTNSAIFTLNKNETGTPTNNAYIFVERGNQTNVAIRYNEEHKQWQYTDDGSQWFAFNSNAQLDLFNEDNYYVKTDIDSKLIAINNSLSLKAPADAVTSLNAQVIAKADLSYVNNQFQNIYPKQVMDNIIAAKVDLATVNTLLLDKADKTVTYTKNEVDSQLALKADAVNVYTKTESDNLLVQKANVVDTYTKADATTVYVKSDVDTLVAPKANSADVYAKTETYNKTEVYNKSEVDTKLADKANVADLASKADATALNTKANLVGNTDIEITDATKDIILTSPDGSRFRITVGNDGVLATAKL